MGPALCRRAIVVAPVSDNEMALRSVRPRGVARARPERGPAIPNEEARDHPSKPPRARRQGGRSPLGAARLDKVSAAFGREAVIGGERTPGRSQSGRSERRRCPSCWRGWHRGRCASTPSCRTDQAVRLGDQVRRWWPQGPSRPDAFRPFPLCVACVEDRLPIAVNPCGVSPAKYSEKFDFGLFVRAQALSLSSPRAARGKRGPSCCGK